MGSGRKVAVRLLWWRLWLSALLGHLIEGMSKSPLVVR